MKNKIHNLSYFVKRLKDSNFIVWKVFNNYSEVDDRLWTLLINPGQESVYITCRRIKDDMEVKKRTSPSLTWSKIPEFELTHGGYLRLQRNLKLRTQSMEVIIEHLTRGGVMNDSDLYRDESK